MRSSTLQAKHLHTWTLLAGDVRLVTCTGLSARLDPDAALVTFELEASHEGLARSAAFWPGLDLDAAVAAITQHIASPEDAEDDDEDVDFERSDSSDGGGLPGLQEQKLSSMQGI